MSKIYKRIIALLLAFCLVAASFPFAWASDDEYVAQHRPTVWEHLIDSTGSSMRKLFNSVVGAFVGSDYCAFTDSGKHEGTEVVSKSVGSDGEYIFFIRCTGCGNTFAYKGSDAQKQYNDSLHSSNLDNGVAVTPSGEFTWSPSWSDGTNWKYYYKDHNNYPSGYWSSAPSPFLITVPNKERIYRIDISDNLIHVPFHNFGDGETIYLSCDFQVPFVGQIKNTTYNIYWNLNADYYYPSGDGWHTSSKSYSFSSPAKNSIFTFVSGDVGFGFSKDQGVTDLPRPVFQCFISDPPTVSIPTTITIDDRDYTVVSIDFSRREVHLEDNRTITYDDDKITIKEGDTIIEEKNYYIEGEDDPDPGPGDTSDPYCNWTPEMWEQLKIMLRQNNSFLEQIYTELVAIEDKVGENGNDYDFSGMYNLIVEIRDALQDIEANPPPDYSSKLEVVANQLANIWGDVQAIKLRLETIEQNTATTNDKLDTVHDDLADVLDELKEHKGILQQILDTLKKILGHVETIDENVEELKDEESSNNFFNNFIMKFHFLGDIFSIVRQLFADITNDAATIQLVDDGSLPIGDLTSQHFPIDGSPVAIGTAPEVLTRFPDDKYHGVDLSAYSGLDLSWYARYKSRVDALISGFLWIAYIWLLFKRAPGIVRGAAMVDETNIKIDDYRNGG